MINGKPMKQLTKLFLLLVLCFVTASASAQMKTAYFMEGSVMRLDLNPALAPQRGYVNFPAFGAIGINLNSNFLSVKNFLYPTDAGLVTFLHESVPSDKFLRGLSRNNYVNLDVSEQLIGFGNYAKRYFWSVGLNLRAIADVNIPKEFFQVLKELQSGSYDLSDMSIGVNSYAELALGFSFPVWKNITVGFRVKGLAGLAQANLEFDKMQLQINDNQVRADLQGRIRGNVTGMSFSHFNGTMSFSDLLSFDGFSASNIKSFGGAIDLGAEVKLLNERLKVSLALNDLGFISWSAASGFAGTTDDVWFEFTGIDLDTGNANSNSNGSFSDIHLSTPEKYTKRLATTLNIGAEYNILDHAIGFGLLSHTKFADGYTYSELTASVNFRPAGWFTASLSHTLIRNRLGVIGFALNAHPKWINFFLGVDYLAFHYGSATLNSSKITFPVGQKSYNVYFGLAIPLSKAKYFK